MANHYEALGVDKSASPEEIKKAYRRMAREFHPDVNAGPEAEEKFKEVTHAYEVLSDPAQRQNYDSGGGPGFSAAGFGGFGDIFETFFGAGGAAGAAGAPGGGGSGAAPRSRKERGGDALLRVEVELAEVIFGTKRDIEVNTAVLCETCEGSCCAPGTRPVVCDMCHGSGQIQRAVRSLLGNIMTSSPCGTCRGFGTVIPSPCVTCAGQGRVRATRTMTVDIPAGVDTGLRLQLQEQGEIGPAGGQRGDLFLEIKVRHDDIFSRNGDDLLGTVEVSMVDAILGTKVVLAGLDGDIAIGIKPGTQSAEVITLKGRGITHLRGAGRGDLKIGVQVLTPSSVNTKEKEMIAEFGRSYASPPPILSKFQQGLFAKVRDRFLSF